MRRLALFAADLSVGMLRTAVHLGRRVTSGRQDATVAYFLGKLLLKGKQELVIERMKRVLGASSHTDSGWTALWKEHLLYIGRTLNESDDIEMMNSGEVLDFIEIEGEDLLKGAMEQRRGVVLLCNHGGNAACFLAGLGHRGYKINLAVNPFRIPSLERRFGEQQRKFRSERTPIGKKLYLTALKALRANGLFCFAIDYFAGYSKRTSWLEFGNSEMLANLAPAIFALRTGTPMLFVSSRRKQDGTHVMTLHSNQTRLTGDVKEDATRVTSFGLNMLINQLRASPAEWWIWDHARIRRKEVRNES